jgi:hypothetical protein
MRYAIFVNVFNFSLHISLKWYVSNSNETSGVGKTFILINIHKWYKNKKESL